MPTAQPITGHGAVLTHDSFVALFLSFSASEQSRPDLDKSHLGTDIYRQFIPGDLIDPGSFTATFFTDVNNFSMAPTGYSSGAPNWDNATVVLGASIPAITTRTPATATITLRKASSGSAAGAKIVGPAFITQLSLPEIAIDSLMQQTAVLRWADGPALVAEA
jgi:hypothetical protein